MGAIRRGVVLFLALGALVPGGAGWAEENPALVETLQILRDRGLIDETKHAELVAKNQAWEAAHPSLLSRLEWSADFRARYENFWFQQDDFGIDTQDRNRGRYRLRLGARAAVNDVVSVGFRLASGEDDHRSTNQSAGKEDDFGPDSIFIDQAYAELAVPRRFLPETMTLRSVLGKQENPFLWRNGKDFLVWDPDITPEGAGFRVAGRPSETLSLYGNAGYFVVDENGSSKDPHVLGFQGGFDLSPCDCFDFGARASFYDWSSVNDAFLTRTNEAGSLIFDESDYQVVEIATYGRIDHFERWPILLYGHVARNLAAQGPPGLDDEDLGWGVGLEVGDKRKLVMLGAGWYHVEANFSPAQFTDSDLFDGFTNREGFLVYASRQLFENTELNLTFFSGDAIEDDPAYDLSTLDDDVPSAERYRLQTDLVFKF